MLNARRFPPRRSIEAPTTTAVRLLIVVIAVLVAASACSGTDQQVAAGAGQPPGVAGAARSVREEHPFPDLSRLVDVALPNYEGMPAPPGMIGVSDKGGATRGFVPDEGIEAWPGSRVSLELGGGAYVGLGYRVIGLDGQLTGYLIDLGFVPVSVADDAVMLREILDEVRDHQAAVESEPGQLETAGS